MVRRRDPYEHDAGRMGEGADPMALPFAHIQFQRHRSPNAGGRHFVQRKS